MGTFRSAEPLSLSLSLSLDSHAQTNPLKVIITDIISIKALSAAWRKFSRGKKSRKDVALYQKYLQKNLADLHAPLSSGPYKHKSYQRFTIHSPKQRQIHKATVADRIVHQAVVTAIEPLFEKRFIYDSYSCRVNKGAHAGVLRLKTFLAGTSKNDTKGVYALKCPSRLYRARPRLDCFSKTVANQPFFKYIERKITPAEIQKIMQKKDWFAPPALLAGGTALLIFFENGSRIVQYSLPQGNFFQNCRPVGRPNPKKFPCGTAIRPRSNPFPAKCVATPPSTASRAVPHQKKPFAFLRFPPRRF